MTDTSLDVAATPWLSWAYGQYMVSRGYAVQCKL